MSRRIVKAALAATGTVATAAALAVAGSPAAHAIPAQDGQAEVIAFAGSDTTFNFIDAYVGVWNSSADNAGSEDQAVNIPAKTTGPVDVPGDADCAAYTLNPPPDGSGAGRRFLENHEPTFNNSGSCVDVARSSGKANATDDPGTQFWAFARDAVSFATFGGSAINLTQQQLKDIYTCTTKTWDALGSPAGKTGTIHRYIPQSGSGTRDFFLSTVLGGVAVAPDAPDCPLDQSLQENDGSAIAGDTQAVAAYSAGQWVFQNHNDTTKLGGALLGSINGVTAASGSGASAAINEAAVLNGTFLGSRDLFNVLDPAIDPGADGHAYNAALRVVGVDDDGPSLLCGGDEDDLIRSFGFVPLPFDTTDPTGTFTTTDSTCRLTTV
jgi:phosphate transport system substrate-binding protein